MLISPGRVHIDGFPPKRLVDMALVHLSPSGEVPATGTDSALVSRHAATISLNETEEVPA